MAHSPHNGHDDHHGHYIIPIKTYVIVFACLITLTLLTVYTAKYVDLGGFNLALALLIAGAKAGLVILFFMALKYDSPVNALVFSLGGVFVLVFMTFTALDTEFRGMIDPQRNMTVLESARADRELRARDSLITPQFRAQPLTYPSGPTDIVMDPAASAADSVAAPDSATAPGATAAPDTAAAPDTTAADSTVNNEP